MILTLIAGATAATLTVGGSGDFATISEAITAAVAGDTVVVGPGTYEERLDFGGKDITVRSELGPAQTILDGGDTWDTSTVSFVSGESVAASLIGFTITNGHGVPLVWNLGRSWTGAGVIILDSAATIEDCVFTRNYARHSGQSVGGGVAVVNGYAEIRDSEFVGNLGYYAGGAVAVLGGVALLEGNSFQGNAAGRGGAVAALDGATVTLRGNRYEGNAALYGGGLFAQGATVVGVSEVFEANEAYLDGGNVHALDSGLTLGRATLSGGLAARDGGNLYVGRGAELMMSASAVLRGSALVGGGLVGRGSDSVLSLNGVLFAENFAVETGADLWSGEAAVGLEQLTSLRAETPGAILWLHGGSAEISGFLAYDADAALTCYAEGLTVAPSWSLLEAAGQESWGGSCAAGEGILSGDPLFADASAWPPDVRLRPGSPAIDAGAPAALDRDGSRADIGAAGGGSPWSP